MKSLMMVPAWAALACAQDVPAFRLDFTLHETNAEQEKYTRTYSMTVVNGGKSSVQAGQRIPFESLKSARDRTAQVELVSVGVFIDCTAKEADGKLQIVCDVESSTLAPFQPPRPASYPPQLYSMKSRIDTRVPLDKLVKVATMDDPTSNRRLEVSLSAAREDSR